MSAIPKVIKKKSRAGSTRPIAPRRALASKSIQPLSHESHLFCIRPSLGVVADRDLSKDLKKFLYGMKSISNTYNDIARFWGRASLMIVSAFVKAVPRLKAKLASIETVEERNASSNTSRIAATQVSSESIGTYLGIEEIYFKNSSGFGAMLFSRKKTNSRYSHYSYTGRLSGSLYREAIRKIIENAQRYRFETFTRLKALQDNPSTHATTKLIKDKTEELEGLLWVILFGDVSGPSFNSAFAEVLHYSTTIKPSDNRIHHYHDSVKNQFEKFSKPTDPRAY